jgi:hypothetical protein
VYLCSHRLYYQWVAKALQSNIVVAIGPDFCMSTFFLVVGLYIVIDQGVCALSMKLSSILLNIFLFNCNSFMFIPHTVMVRLS